MAPVALSVGLVAIALSTFAAAQQSTFPETPLASKTSFTYPSGLPYQVDTDVGLIRGVQSGYNICNSTTENQDSMCQTAMFNNIEDFCIWAPPEPNSDVGSHEGEMVAWCTKAGRGTRLIPEGALTGLQWLRAPAYVQAVGFIDQVKINLPAEDWGGEMDPHGADLRGNPMGGVLFSNAWSGSNNTYVQVVEWNLFLGGGAFCLKACDPAGSDDHRYCEHIFDRIGCAYNSPNNAKNNVFEVCDSDNQVFPGIYTVDGVEMTYQQPPESLGAISTMPYQPVVPPTSNCRTYESTDLYSDLATVTAPGGSTPTGTGTRPVAPTGSRPAGAAASGGASGTRTGTSAGAQQTTSGASTLAVSGFALLSVAVSALFLS